MPCSRIMKLLVNFCPSKRLNRFSMMENMNSEDIRYLILLIFALILQASAERTVLTSHGVVRGIEVLALDKKVDAFLGIPFAKPPIGELRFQNPVPAKPWDGVYEAIKKSQHCMQYVIRPVPYAPTGNFAEDCLYLNIWSPSTAHNDSAFKPVLVFIHGGAYAVGTANLEIYDGSTLAAYGDIIVASFNYRLGAFGFLAAFIPEANGSMGMNDHIMALKWIKNNAKAFGGDPDRITLMGQSVGAMNIVGIMLPNTIDDLFERIILHSGAASFPFYWHDNNERLITISNNLAKEVGCADDVVTMRSNPKQVVTCLKQLPAAELTRAEGNLLSVFPVVFFPRTGDNVMPLTPPDYFRKGDFKKVEVLMGTSKTEGYFLLEAAFPEYFETDSPPNISKNFAKYFIKIFMEKSHQSEIQEIIDFYIYSNHTGNYAETIGNFVGDFMMDCGSIFQAEFFSLHKSPVYFFQFNHKPSNSLYPDWIKATHFEDVQFLFGLPLKYPDKYTEEELVFTRRMIDRWIAFIKTGDPNIPGATTWPRYTHVSPEYLSIDLEENVRNQRLDDYRCEIWRERFRHEIDEELLERVQNSSDTPSTH